MAQPIVFNINKRSRYRYTNMFQQGRVLEFGTYVPPPEFENIMGDETFHTVNQSEIGFPDLIAVKYFGDGMEEMGWAICRLNGLVNLETDMYPGQVLRIPNADRVKKYVQNNSQ